MYVYLVVMDMILVVSRHTDLFVDGFMYRFLSVFGDIKVVFNI